MKATNIATGVIDLEVPTPDDTGHSVIIVRGRVVDRFHYNGTDKVIAMADGRVLGMDEFVEILKGLLRGLRDEARAIGMTMPCGWGCGAKLAETELPKHFTECPKRPGLLGVELDDEEIAALEKAPKNVQT